MKTRLIDSVIAWFDENGSLCFEIAAGLFVGALLGWILFQYLVGLADTLQAGLIAGRF